jgi:putative DNA primase/helicase
LASPVGAFVRDSCVVAVGHRLAVSDLFNAWKLWCEREELTGVTNLATFGRNFSAAFPDVRHRRSTGQSSFYDGITLKELVDAMRNAK